MKRLLPFLMLVLTSLAMTGCNVLDGLDGEGDPDEQVGLEVHLQDYFGTTVQVTVDQQVVFDGEVEGGNFSGPAAVIPLEVAVGSHSMTVTINGTLEKQTTFDAINIQVIGVRYIPELDEIRFEFFSEQPLYL